MFGVISGLVTYAKSRDLALLSFTKGYVAIPNTHSPDLTVPY